MAERVEVIRITLESDQFKAQMVAREKEIRNTKGALEELKATIKAHGEATAAQVKAQLELEATLRGLNKEQSEAKRKLDANTVAQKEATGSVKQMRAELALLTEQYNSLTEEERENTKEGKALTAQTKALSDKLKDAEKAIGDNRRSVGGYTGAMLEAAKGVTIFGVNVGELSDDLKGKFTTGINIAKSGFSSFNNLLKTSVIGLVIASFVSLVSYFKRTEEGGEKLERILSFLGGAFDVIIGRAAAFGKQLVDTFTAPVETAKKLGNFLKLAFTDPQAALEQLKTSGKNFQIQLDDIAKKAINAGKAMAELTGRTQALEDAQNAVLPSNERLKGQIAQLILQAKEQGKSEKERVSGLKEAGVLEEKLTAQRLRYAKEELNIAIARDVIDKRNGKLAEEKSKATIDAEVKVIQIQNESLLQRQQIRNRESGLIEEINNERIAKEREVLKKRLDDEKAAIEIRLVQAAQGSADELAIREELLRKELEITLKTGNLTATQRLLSEAKTNAEILKARAKFFSEIESINLLATKDSGKATEEIIDQRGKQMQASNKVVQNEKENKDKLAEDEKKFIEETKQGAYERLNAITAAFGEETLIYKTAFKLKQGLALAEAAIALPQLLTENKLTGARISGIAPPFTVPLGIAYTVGADIAAIALIAKQIADIAEIKIGGFYHGGYTEKGNPKEQARNLGTKPYVYHKSEYVTPHDVLAMPEGQYHVSRLEELRLKKRGFRQNLHPNSYLEGGFVLPANAGNGAIDYAQIGTGVAASLKNVTIVTKIRDVSTGLHDLTTLQNKVNS